MEKELLKIYNEDSQQIGVATRDEVHNVGHWHEVFHCWFVQQERNRHYLYLQLRSHHKKDYPNLFDITAAGHLLASETVEDGVREIKEELGIDLNFRDLISLGMLKYSVANEHLIDNELANVFLYKCNLELDQFILQKEEVSGIVKVDLFAFQQLWLGERDTVNIHGFYQDEVGTKVLIESDVGRDQFVPHQASFYQQVISRIVRKSKQR
ncbi:NUDIX hydrolase [Metabacillus malikii]|uniref:Isopentenyldiphosphate isomerase n=1 Tax=Metabacillus malikii TaxID=1504265 RepID=A0ABT9ZCE0_9BACI|nr:NUDIX domain-containing protein [Metabacillus malikii]MDQ0229921.1 isopentenyldiphosphate isomerase [Metabacillus malikii]